MMTRVLQAVSRIAAILTLSMLAIGCGGSEDIIVDGSSTVFRISKAAQESFAQSNNDVTVVVDNHGTGGGFGRYVEGEVDIVDASRPAKKEEEEKAKAAGFDWTRFLVAYDGVTLVTNPKNDWAKSITVEELKKIWSPDSKIQTWKDVNPAWPDRKIVLFSPDNDSGTFEFFVEAIVGGKKQRTEGIQQSSDDNILVTGVAGDEGGLGYFGYAYYVANKSKLQALPVQKGADAKPVTPSLETILSKEYSPLSRPLYIYVKNSAAKRPEVAKFVKHYLDNIESLVQKAGYVPPTKEDQEANRKAYESLVGAK